MVSLDFRTLLKRLVVCMCRFETEMLWDDVVLCLVLCR
jgi:hypothetical protein